MAAIPEDEVTLLSEADIPFSVGGTLRFQCFTHHATTTDFVVLSAGNIKGDAVHMRVHDACLTSEVFGSCKCDCKHQLIEAQRHIGEQARKGSGGIIVYTFQEGRNIGLANKIAAYSLQIKHGLDTVEANEALGLPVENRTYEFLPSLLRLFGTNSVVLLTNNPFKMASLATLGVNVVGRETLQVRDLPSPAADYVMTKKERMGHMVKMEDETLAEPNRGSDAKKKKHQAIMMAPCLVIPSCGGSGSIDWLMTRTKKMMISKPSSPVPFVTLTFAQSLNGCIARAPSEKKLSPLILSGNASMSMTHALRAEHDMICIGVGTVLADNPRLTVRLVQGSDPIPVILDGQLQTPVNCNLVRLAGEKYAEAQCKCASVQNSKLDVRSSVFLVVYTTQDAIKQQASTYLSLAMKPGVAVEVCESSKSNGFVDLNNFLKSLKSKYACESLMVEGGAGIISSFLASSRLVDNLIVTIAPLVISGGLSPYDTESNFPRITDHGSFKLGDDIILFGRPHSQCDLGKPLRILRSNL